MSEKIGFCKKVFRQLWYVEQLGFTVRSNTEFTSNLQSILDTCEQCEFLNSKAIISTAKETLGFLSLTTARESKNIMKNYRLRQLKKCKTILNQYSEEIIERAK